MAERTWTAIGETDVADTGEVLYTRPVTERPAPALGTPEYNQWAYENDQRQKKTVQMNEEDRFQEQRDLEATQRAKAPAVPAATEPVAPWEFVGMPTSAGFYEMLGSSEFWKRDVAPRLEESMAALPLAVLGSAVDIPVISAHILRWAGEQLRGNPNDFGFFADMPNFAEIPGTTDWYGTKAGMDIDSPSFIAPQFITPGVFDIPIIKGMSTLVQNAGFASPFMWSKKNEVLARSADQADKLELTKRLGDRTAAEELYKAGAQMSDIWEATNWIRIRDDWRFWYDSSKTVINQDAFVYNIEDTIQAMYVSSRPLDTTKVSEIDVVGTLGELWGADELYDMLPDMKDVEVTFSVWVYPKGSAEIEKARANKIAVYELSDGTKYSLTSPQGSPRGGGVVTSDGDSITTYPIRVVGSRDYDELRSTLAHEAGGHIVQAHSGWFNGGSPTLFFLDGERQEIAQYIVDDIVHDMIKGDPKLLNNPKKLKEELEYKEDLNKLVVEYNSIMYNDAIHDPTYRYNDAINAKARKRLNAQVLKDLSNPNAPPVARLNKKYEGGTLLDAMVDQALLRYRKYRGPLAKQEAMADYQDLKDAALESSYDLMKTLEPPTATGDVEATALTQWLAKHPPTVASSKKRMGKEFARDDTNAMRWYMSIEGEAFARLESLAATPEGHKKIEEVGILRAIDEFIEMPMKSGLRFDPRTDQIVGKHGQDPFTLFDAPISAENVVGDLPPNVIREGDLLDSLKKTLDLDPLLVGKILPLIRQSLPNQNTEGLKDLESIFKEMVKYDPTLLNRLSGEVTK